MIEILAAQQEDEAPPRLYSKGWKPRGLLAPADDVIAPEHAKAHEMLVRWGLWARSRAASSGLASIEGLYTRAGTPPATAPLSTDPRIMSVERGVVAIMDPYSKRLLIMAYIFRCSSYTICRALKVKFDAYPVATYKARHDLLERVPDLAVK